MNLIAIPSSVGSMQKNKGCERAPEYIARKLKYKFQKFLVNEEDIKQNIELIKNQAKEFLDKEAIFVGGDHSITYALVETFKQKNLGLIIFDAHPDCTSTVDVPTNEDFVRHLIENNIVPPDRIIFIGLRNIPDFEKKFLEEKKILFFTPEKLFLNIQDICDAIMEKARSFENLYISFDIDAIDPVFAPGTAYKEVNGLLPQQAFYLLNRLSLLKNLKWFDIVEVNPSLDKDELTISLAAEIIKNETLRWHSSRS